MECWKSDMIDVGPYIPIMRIFVGSQWPTGGTSAKPQNPSSHAPPSADSKQMGQRPEAPDGIIFQRYPEGRNWSKFTFKQPEIGGFYLRLCHIAVLNSFFKSHQWCQENGKWPSLTSHSPSPSAICQHSMSRTVGTLCIFWEWQHWKFWSIHLMGNTCSKRI